MAEDIKLRELHILKLVELKIRNILLSKLNKGRVYTAKDVENGY